MNNDDKPNAIETVGEVVDEYVKERVAQIKQHERAYTHDNPEHYRQEGKVECIDAMPDEMRRWYREWIDDNGAHAGPHWEAEEDFAVMLMMAGFSVGSSFKYRYRKGHKDPEEQEQKKIDWYDAFALHLLDPEKHPDPRSR